MPNIGISTVVSKQIYEGSEADGSINPFGLQQLTHGLTLVLEQ